MANKKVSQLTSKPSVLITDLFPIADPTTGQLFKTTISDLGTAIGSGVSSVNTLVGAVVLDTDDIQELVSPTNKWFTDTRARATLSGGTGISYNSGTGVITNTVTSGQIATALGYTPADDALVVKLAGSQTITGTKTFQQAPLMDIGVGFKNGNGVYNTIQSIVTGWQMPVNGNNHNLIFSTSTNYTYTFPNASGTIALTSDLTPYALDNTVVKLTGTQNISGVKNFNAGITANVTSGGAQGFISTNTSGSGYSIFVQNNSVAGGAIGINISTSADGINIGNDGSGRAIYVSNSTLGGYGNGLFVDNYDNGTGIQVQSTSAGDAAYFAHASGRGLRIYSSATGYGLIINNATSATSVPFTIQKNGVNKVVFTDAGAATFASTLSATGATLTGALSGTSATFSGDGSFGSGTADVTITIPTNNTGSGYAGRILGKNSTGQLIIQHRDNSATFVNAITISSGGGTPVVSLGGTLNVTGAATFSSSVTASGNIFTTNASLFNTDNTISLNTNNFLYVIGSASGGASLNSSSNRNTFIAVRESNIIDFWTNGAERMRINAAGRLIVGATTDGATGLVQIHGTARAVQLVASQGGITAGNFTIYSHDDDNGYINTIRLVNTGDFNFRFDNVNKATINRTTGAYVATSDINKKKDIELSNIGLFEVMQLKPTLYRMKEDESNGQKELGFIAQEVKELIPNAYFKSGDFIGLNFNPIVAALTKAVQELKQKIDILENK